MGGAVHQTGPAIIRQMTVIHFATVLAARGGELRRGDKFTLTLICPPLIGAGQSSRSAPCLNVLTTYK
jgi:hypothetical protein